MTVTAPARHKVADPDASAGGLGPPTPEPTPPALSARAAVDAFLDAGSFLEIDALAEHDCRHFGTERRTVPGDGLITGQGTVDGRPVLVYAHDAGFLRGSSSRMHAVKICKVLVLAIRVGIPVVALNNSSGIRIHEGVDAGATFGDVFHKTVAASGVVPQISLILGDCAGGAAYTPALTDFVIMVDGQSTMFLTGPAVIRKATGEDVTKEQIGGGAMHATTTGLAHLLAASPREALTLARDLLGYLPQNNCVAPPFGPDGAAEPPSVAAVLPGDANTPFDVLDVIAGLVDDGDFLEIQGHYAANLVCAFARMGGRVVGIVANQPNHLAGCLDVKASLKAARFVRSCDSFGIPLITLLDVPGYLPGREQETGGIIGAGAKLLHAYCEAVVPKIAVVLRKAYGGAYPTLANRYATDMTFALPGAEIAIMGPEGAVDVIFRRQMRAAADPVARRGELVRDYRDAHASALYAAKRAYVDAIVDPDQVRRRVIAGLGLLAEKIPGAAVRRHSNIPL